VIDLLLYSLTKLRVDDNGLLRADRITDVPAGGLICSAVIETGRSLSRPKDVAELCLALPVPACPTTIHDRPTTPTRGYPTRLPENRCGTVEAVNGDALSRSSRARRTLPGAIPQDGAEQTL
jgi:hypothetical protein